MRIALLILLLAGCNDGRNRIGTETGEICEVVDDCYQGNVDREGLSGAVVCLDRVPDGYCTHECETDDDCCAADGECDDDSPPQVCAPFESENRKMCFLSCEDEVDSYCTDNLSEDFNCSSTGGGNQNRKICSPKI